MIIAKAPAENSIDALGCRKAPDKIIENLDDIYTSESGKQSVKNNLKIENIQINEDYETCIYDYALDKISSEEKVIFLGGDHSITYPIAKAFYDVCESEDKEAFLVVFDAHADCREIKENEGNIHWLRKLIEGGFPSERVILIGLRKSSLEENKFLLDNKIRVYQMKDLMDFQEICDVIMEQINKFQIYISIDIDATDGVFVPGTARPEPTGFTSRQLIYFLQRLNILKGVRIIDIVEINPDKDFNDITVKLGSKILGEII